MNTSDRFQYYENFYDSFCSEFAIPRAHTSTSVARPSSALQLEDLQQFTTTSTQRRLIRNQNGNNSNHFYYFDTPSDAFSSEERDGQQKPNEYVFSRSRIAQQIFSSENNDSENEDLDGFSETESFSCDQKRYAGYENSNIMQFSLQSDEPVQALAMGTKKKGPTPPPKPLKMKLLSPRTSSSPLYTNSNPDIRNEEMSSLNPNAMMDHQSQKLSAKFLHASFESIASCPAPPPPKHIQAAPMYSRHMSCEMLPNFSFTSQNDPSLNRKLSQPSYLQRPHASPPPPPSTSSSSRKKRDTMSLSEFLKLTSNTVFKKPPFGRKEKSPSFMPCGHPNNGNSGTTSSSPTPSNSSDGPSRSSIRDSAGPLLTFRKKCGVTKRRKKIDESLFTPTSSSSQNSNTCTDGPARTPRSHSFDKLVPMEAAESSNSQKYSITATTPNNPIVPPNSSIFLAETNHDTEFELDPLPEKDCDDVLDFSWAMPPLPPHEATSSTQAQDGLVRKASRKTSNCSNGRPSSRCSLIINTLMGHLTNITKAEGEEPQQQHHHHQYSGDSSNNNNNFFQHHHEHHHHHHHNTDHFHPPVEDHNGPHNDSIENVVESKSKANKKSHHRKASQLFRSSTKKKFHDNSNNTSNPNKMVGAPSRPNNMNTSPQESDHNITIPTSGSNTYPSRDDDDHENHQHHHHQEQYHGIPSGQRHHGASAPSRSITAFDFGVIGNDELNEEEFGNKNIFLYPNGTNGGSGSRSLGNVSNAKHADEYSSLNVIGCIPRVSLQNSKRCVQTQQQNDAFQENTSNQPMPQFQIESLLHQDVNNAVVSSAAMSAIQRTCCGGGLFRGDPLCCDKFDKYYGQYSLTGLNFESMEPSLLRANSKSAEELVLDRYYAHCNKVIRNRANSNEKKKLKKRTYSLPEKIWKNVVPIINSANNSSGQRKETHLCGHLRAKQIEECFYCLSEQGKQSQSLITSPQTKSNPAHSNNALATGQSRNARSNGRGGGLLMSSRKARNSAELERDLDMDLERLRAMREEQQLQRITNKMKTFGVSVPDQHCNNQSRCRSFKTRTRKNVISGKFDRENDEDDDVIGEFSSSSCFSYSGGGTGGKKNPNRRKTKSVVMRSCGSSGISCRNTTSSDDSHDDDDDGSSREYHFTIGQSEVDVDCQVHNHQASEEEDDEEDSQGQLKVKMKVSTRKVDRDLDDDDDDGIESSGEMIKSASRGRRKCVGGNTNNNQRTLLEIERDEEMHLGKLKRTCVARAESSSKLSKEMNPIKLQQPRRLDPTTIIEDESCSSTITSLPTNSPNRTERDKRGINSEAGDVMMRTQEQNLSPKKNRVKWTFLTSGLVAKATRRLSGSSRSSSLSSFTTCSSTGDYEGAKRKSESGSTSWSKRKEELEEKSKIMMMNGTRANKSDKGILRDGGREVARSEDKEKVKMKMRRRNTAEVYLNDDKTGKNLVGVGITTASGTRVLTRESQNLRGKQKKVPRTGSLKRKPSLSTKKKTTAAISAPPPFRRKRSDDSAKAVPGAPGVFLRKKPIRLPPLSQAVSVPAARAFARVGATTNGSSVFSAFSSSSCNSSTSGSNRSSSSGYTSNVSKTTQKFLKNFRKRWAKKNNKVGDGDEEHASRSKHDNDDSTDSEEPSPVEQKLQHRNSFGSRGSINRTSLVRRKSHVSKHLIFSTFYTGPFIKDLLEEEKIYATKDFDDVTLDLESGEVKKTSDGTLLFTADPVCFNSKKLKKQKHKLKQKEKDGKSEKTKKKDLLQRLKKPKKGSSNDEVVITTNPSENQRKLLKKVEDEVVHFPGKISKRVSASSGLIKSYLGISKKDLRATGALATNGKNQSVEDVCGPGSEDPGQPDTPTRVSSGILGRLRDSSRSGFNLGNSSSSRNSSKKRGPKQDSTEVAVSQTDSPSSQQKNRNSLSDSVGARGGTDDASDTRRHSHQRSCSSEEELTSINSCENRLSSLTLGSGGSGDNNGEGDGSDEYNGPFQGRALALVDCMPSPYDRHALRYKKGDIIDVIDMRRTGLWLGQVNGQRGFFKFINVKLLPKNVEKEDELEDEGDGVIDDADDDSAGDYADTSNYQCSLNYGTGEENPGLRGSQRNDPRLSHHSTEKVQHRGNPKLGSWDEQRQSIANVINGTGNDERERYHKDPLGILNPEDPEDNDDNDDEEDEELDDEEEIDEQPDGGQVQDQNDKTRRRRNVGEDRNEKGFPKNHRRQVVGKRGRPKSVGDLLLRLNLDQYTRELEGHGFESLDLLKELEEEDLDTIGIQDAADRRKILTAVELLREWDESNVPGQTLYQKQYYQTKQRTPKPIRAFGQGGNVAGQPILQPPNGRVIVGSGGSPAISHQQQIVGGGPVSSPQFYRLHHPRDSGIFVGKVDGEEDADEQISGADLSCAESHPDVETEEIILSPINLQKGGGGNTAAGGNGGSASWHPHHQSNINKQGSHHHINRFISKGCNPQGVISSFNPVTAQQPTSSASSSGSASSSSGIAAAGADSLYGSGSSTGSSGGGSTQQTSSIVVVENQKHPQWNSKQPKGRRDASPAYNSDSVRNRFLHAKSLFEPNGVCGPAGRHVYENGESGGAGVQNRFLYCEKSSDSGISTNSPPPLKNEFRS